jgi:hypothetical protein
VFACTRPDPAQPLLRSIGPEFAPVELPPKPYLSDMAFLWLHGYHRHTFAIEREESTLARWCGKSARMWDGVMLGADRIIVIARSLAFRVEAVRGVLHANESQTRKFDLGKRVACARSACSTHRVRNTRQRVEPDSGHVL